jgi:hypothetical protein
MIRNRLIEEKDYNELSSSLLLDEYHTGTEPSFFYEEGTRCLVYEDEKGTILFLRGSPILASGIAIIKLDIQFVSNEDKRRNLKAIIVGFPELERMAINNGFTGLMFESNSPLLKEFCVKRLGFEDFGSGLLAKVLQIDKSRLDKIDKE